MTGLIIVAALFVVVVLVCVLGMCQVASESDALDERQYERAGHPGGNDD